MVELHTARIAQQVDAVGGDPELDDLLRAVGIEEVGTAERGESLVGVGDVLRIGADPEVHVLRVPWFRVVDEGEAADDQVTHLEALEHLEHVLEVLDRIQPSALRGPVVPTGLHQFDVAADRHQRGEALLRRHRLPEVEVPALRVLEARGAMGHDAPPTFFAPFLK
jgi:hypothetical protein